MYSTCILSYYVFYSILFVFDSVKSILQNLDFREYFLTANRSFQPFKRLYDCAL